ncbi:DgyrCDS2345 [Dimorphilus gyrociliatus]|uniref:DgyrCDS2345 n=1 Tax=Dimorphilus gyrociliatus TaxID=2664684 RepID=A0A7I8VCS9_9ANNE|nr:DgyrCDS2345 [Dimorphilus gyrociliatus]
MFLIFIILSITLRISEGADNCQLTTFPFFVMELLVDEELPVGSKVSSVNILGKENLEVLTSIEDTRYFHYDGETRIISIKSRIDSESVGKKITTRIWCQKIGENLDNSSITVYVNVRDINDNAPEILQSSRNVTINEFTPPKSEVFQLLSRDADSLTTKIIYSIIDGKHSEKFYLASNSAILTTDPMKVFLSKELDYESVSLIKLVVNVKDVENPQLNSTAIIDINIEDADDENPLFTSNFYTGKIKKNADVGTVVKVFPNRIFSWDPDVSFGNNIIYGILQHKADGDKDLFEINPTSGLVTIKRKSPVIYENNLFVLLITATQENNANRTTNAMLRIELESDPIYLHANYSSRIFENSPPNTFVLNVAAFTQNGTSKRVLYTLEGNQNSENFKVIRTNGDIFTKKILDYEEAQMYNFTVIAQADNFTSTAKVIIEVMDINDNNPTFTKNNYQFQAARENGSVIGHVTATDADVHYNLDFKLMNDLNIFKIEKVNETAAALYLLAEETVITPNKYMLHLIVDDGGNPPRQGSSVAIVEFPRLVIEENDCVSSTPIAIIIALSILCGVLLIIVIILLVCCIRLRLRKKESDEYYAYC